MLTCQDIVFATLKGELADSKKIIEKEYERIYFTHGKEDQIESKNKQYNGMKNVGVITEPISEKSIVPIDTLWMEMFAHFITLHPGEDIRPYLLELIDRSYDTIVRLRIKRELEHSQPAKQSAKLQDLAASMVAMSLYPDIESALEFLHSKKEEESVRKSEIKSVSLFAGIKREKLLVNQGFRDKP